MSEKIDMGDFAETVRDRRQRDDSGALRDRIISEIEEMRPTMAEYMACHPCKGFKPSAYYQRHADWLDIHFKDVRSYQEDISDRIGLFRCMKTKEVTGVRVYGLSSVVGLDIVGILKLFLRG